MQIKISEIEIGERKRQLNSAKVTELVESIGIVGLLQPVAVVKGKGHYVLVAGLHRIEAFKVLSRDTIPATVLELDDLHRELGEIDGNLLHAALTALEEALQVARRKEIYEVLYPETKHGAVGGGHPKQSRQDGESAERFTVDTAKLSGKGERTVQRQAMIGEVLGEYAGDLRGTAVEDNQSKLLKLAKMSKPELKKALKQIAENKPVNYHVSDDSYEWFTPEEYIEATRKVMGGIDLDPASCDAAQTVIRAKRYYTRNNDGLDAKWSGRVWLNPPYSMPLIKQFVDRVISEYESGNVTQAVVLTNNSTDTEWFHKLVRFPVCFTRGRIRFWNGQDTLATRQGQALFYLGDRIDEFAKSFGEFGAVLTQMAISHPPPVADCLGQFGFDNRFFQSSPLLESLARPAVRNEP